LLRVVALEQGIKLHLPGPDLRLWLALTLVGEGGLVGPQYPAHRVARHMQLAADPLQRPSLNIKGTPDPGAGPRSNRSLWFVLRFRCDDFVKTNKVVEF